MSMITIINTLKQRSREENGFSLIELLVAITITAVVIAASVGILSTASKSGQRFQEYSVAQANLTTSASSLENQIKSSTQFLVASDSVLRMKTISSDQNYDVTIFAYQASSCASIPTWLYTSSVTCATYQAKFPTSNALMMQRVNLTTGVVRLSTLVPSYTPSPSKALFAYYNKSNTIETTNLALIKRVTYYIQRTLPNRVIPLEASGSATSKVPSNMVVLP